MRLKALSVNSVVMEGNVPTKAQKNNLSSALIYILVQTLLWFYVHARGVH